jgi:hypothetical protein
MDVSELTGHGKVEKVMNVNQYIEDRDLFEAMKVAGAETAARRTTRRLTLPSDHPPILLAMPSYAREGVFRVVVITETLVESYDAPPEYAIKLWGPFQTPKGRDHANQRAALSWTGTCLADAIGTRSAPKGRFGLASRRRCSPRRSPICSAGLRAVGLMFAPDERS